MSADRKASNSTWYHILSHNVTVVTGSLTTFHRLPIQAPLPAAQNPTRGFVICRSRPRLNHAWFNFYISVICRSRLHPLGVRDSMNCQSEMIQTNAHHPYPQPKDADLHYPSDIRTYTWSETNSFDIWFAVKMDISNCFELFLYCKCSSGRSRRRGA